MAALLVVGFLRLVSRCGVAASPGRVGAAVQLTHGLNDPKGNVRDDGKPPEFHAVVASRRTREADWRCTLSIDRQISEPVYGQRPALHLKVDPRTDRPIDDGHGSWV